MSKGIYLFGINSQSDEEHELFNKLYDLFSHNEISGKEVIKEIADYSGLDMNNLEQYSSYEIVEIEKPVYEDSRFILDYDPYCGAYDVYMRVFC